MPRLELPQWLELLRIAEAVAAAEAGAVSRRGCKGRSGRSSCRCNSYRHGLRNSYRLQPQQLRQLPPPQQLPTHSANWRLHAFVAQVSRRRTSVRSARRLSGVMVLRPLLSVVKLAPGEGMQTPIRYEVLEQVLSVVTLSRPLVEAIQRKDRDLASQVRRALSSVGLNISEGFGTASGHARLRLETARGTDVGRELIVIMFVRCRRAFGTCAASTWALRAG